MDTELEQLRSYLVRHKKLLNAKRRAMLEEGINLNYWEGYEDAMAVFNDKIESLLREKK
jgi:hypothetical protein